MNRTLPVLNREVIDDVEDILISFLPEEASVRVSMLSPIAGSLRTGCGKS